MGPRSYERAPDPVGVRRENVHALQGFDQRVFELLQNADEARRPSGDKGQVGFQFADEELRVWNDAEFTLWEKFVTEPKSCGYATDAEMRLCEFHRFLDVSGGGSGTTKTQQAGLGSGSTPSTWLPMSLQ